MEIPTHVNNEKRNKVIELIAKNKLPEAIKETIAITKQKEGKSYFETVVLSMELHALEQAITTDRIEWEVANKHKRKLAFRILTILDNLAS